MIPYKYISTIASVFVTIHCYGQISTWTEEETKLPGGGNNGIISYIDSVSVQDMSSGIFENWNTILGEFGEEAVINNSTINSKVEEIAKSNGEEKKTFSIKGKTLDLPTAIDENGIDWYLLTDEGINIYMAIAEPVFFQDIDADTKKWIRFYAYSHRERTKKLFKKFTPWEPRIQDCFQSFGVPPEIAVLCLIESGCTYKAVSPVGATGMWQFMPGTAREFGLTVNGNIDERYDPVCSTTAAAKLLMSMNADIKDWTLTMAAYNCGKNRILNRINRYNTRDWNIIRNSLPEETKQYIPAIIAVYYVWTYREQLGFDIPKP